MNNNDLDFIVTQEFSSINKKWMNQIFSIISSIIDTISVQAENLRKIARNHRFYSNYFGKSNTRPYRESDIYYLETLFESKNNDKRSSKKPLICSKLNLSSLRLNKINNPSLVLLDREIEYFMGRLYLICLQIEFLRYAKYSVKTLIYLREFVESLVFVVE